jgi:hypothetical protein
MSTTASYKIVKHRIIMAILLAVLGAFVSTSEGCDLQEEHPVYSYVTE